MNERKTEWGKKKKFLINVEEFAKSLGNISLFTAKEILNDGRIMGLISEYLICDKLDWNKMTKEKAYDATTLDGDKIEIRVITESSGMSIVPSSFKGAGRKFNKDLLYEKFSKINGYSFVDGRKIVDGSFSFVSIEVDSIKEKYESGFFGKCGQTKSKEKIDSFFNNEGANNNRENKKKFIG